MEKKVMILEITVDDKTVSVNTIKNELSLAESIGAMQIACQFVIKQSEKPINK